MRGGYGMSGFKADWRVNMERARADGMMALRL